MQPRLIQSIANSLNNCISRQELNDAVASANLMYDVEGEYFKEEYYMLMELAEQAERFLDAVDNLIGGIEGVKLVPEYVGGRPPIDDEQPDDTTSTDSSFNSKL